jgi:catechol 2,3-dioxygenase-like lactoylglutathione lyase family enzyme
MTAAKQGRAGKVTRLLRISLPVADLDRTEIFYREGLGFEPVGSTSHDDPAFGKLLGLEGLRARSLRMRIGSQEVEFFAYRPAGGAYPAQSSSMDLWFQHFAIVVSDIDSAHARVRSQAGFSPISHDGPQRLPPATGSVTAFKFRDPDGHPLELIHFPRGSGAEIWHDPARRDLFLGIDHSAISVSDTAASKAFYTRLLGMIEAGHSLNEGPAQARLDGVENPVVDVTAFRPTHRPTPHLELLGYHLPHDRRQALSGRANDIAGAQLVLEIDDIRSLALRLTSAGTAFVSPGLLRLSGGQEAALILDPDGHRLMLTGASPG